MPIVVLVDGNSASASEITSGSLQDLDRAVILGTRTFGKGLVQQVINLPYGGLMKLTTGKYYIPSGRCIQAIRYKHNNGGRMEHVPDSLTKTFYTRLGRAVKRRRWHHSRCGSKGRFCTKHCVLSCRST